MSEFPLTKEQETASKYLWSHDDRALSLIAGAGSGKTSTMVASIAECATCYASPQEIAVMTFTRKAAAEMRERMELRGIQTAFCGTIHSFAFSLLKESGSLPQKLIHNPGTILARLLRERYPTMDHLPADIFQNIRGLHKYRDSPTMKKILTIYEEWKQRNRYADFDDLLASALEVAQKKTQPYRVLFVDESQDTSLPQLLLLHALNAEKIYFVGDDWQSIYSFRGSLMKVENHWPSPLSFKLLYLKQNFRSQKKIVDYSNHFIKSFREIRKKTLQAYHDPVKKPVLHIAANRAKAMHSLTQILKRKPTAETVILVRTNYLRHLLERAGVPVPIMTIHASKGLEFEHVIIFGIAPDIIPHVSSTENPEQIAEEARILYVAMTRAKRHLDLIAWEANKTHSRFLPKLIRASEIHYV